jgi:RecG-like helicase
LALVLYGDLDISRIDEMPKGRGRVATYVVNESYRARLYAFIRKQVAEGGQVYVVCPAIEEKEEPRTTGRAEGPFIESADFAGHLELPTMPICRCGESGARDLSTRLAVAQP